MNILGSVLCGLSVAATLAMVAPSSAAARDGVSLSDADLRRIADIFAGSAVAEGRAVGIGVAVVRSGRPTSLFTYGYADWANQRPFTDHSRFEIGSVTKVFTTSLLGQAVAAGLLGLDTKLGAYGSVLGQLPASTTDVTLGELGSFTAGYPTLAPLCATSSAPGCLPNDRPAIAQYDATDFADYFRGTPAPTTLPAGYLYSDYSTGLVGLLLGATPGTPLDDNALVGWLDLLQDRLLRPLHMRETELVSPVGATNLAEGYQLPVLDTVVTGGSIASVTNVSQAGPYDAPPRVTVIGGGGHGASIVANLQNGMLSRTLTVLDGGSGYIAPARLVFDPPAGQGGTTATGEAIIRGDRVAGIRITNAGSFYGANQTVAVRITGGRHVHGRDATLRVHLVSDSVSFVSVVDGGARYIQPVSVLLTPGHPFNSTVPIWAPAGALKSSLRDMARFTAAALLPPRSGLISGPIAQDGPRLSRSIRNGFRIAEQPLVCQFAIPMPLQQCPSTAPLGGLAWTTIPADSASGYPATILKDGGLTGFSTLVLLMPSRGLGVVAFVNSRQSAAQSGPSSGADTGESDATIGIAAPLVAHEIMTAIYDASAPATRPFSGR